MTEPKTPPDTFVPGVEKGMKFVRGDKTYVAKSVTHIGNREYNVEWEEETIASEPRFVYSMPPNVEKVARDIIARMLDNAATEPDEADLGMIENTIVTSKGWPQPEPEIILEMTSSACPEQYSAFCDGKRVGYLRLRGGLFRVDYPDCGEETIFETEEVRGDGAFNDDEREHWLAVAKEKIRERMKKESSAEPDWRELDAALFDLADCSNGIAVQRIVSFFKNHFEDLDKKCTSLLHSMELLEKINERLESRLHEAEKPSIESEAWKSYNQPYEDAKRRMNEAEKPPKAAAPESEDLAEAEILWTAEVRRRRSCPHCISEKPLQPEPPKASFIRLDGTRFEKDSSDFLREAGFF